MPILRRTGSAANRRTIATGSGRQALSGVDFISILDGTRQNVRGKARDTIMVCNLLAGVNRGMPELLEFALE